LILIESNTDLSFHDEVHFNYFFLLVIDNTFLLVVREMARSESKSYIMKEFTVLILVRVKEESEVVENIIEKIMDNDTSFDCPWKGTNELISRLNFANSISSPIVLKVRVDLSV